MLLFLGRVVFFLPFKKLLNGGLNINLNFLDRLNVESLDTPMVE